MILGLGSSKLKVGHFIAAVRIRLQYNSYTDIVIQLLEGLPKLLFDVTYVSAVICGSRVKRGRPINPRSKFKSLQGYPGWSPI